jgi:hypothetical protein
MSHSQLSRLEHGELALPTVDQIARAAAVSGLRVSFRLYPEGDPIRDAGHHRLLERLRSRVHPGLWWRTEVPLGIAGDLRCWDAEIGTRAWSTKIEAEMHLGDIQAFERRLALKRRDGGDPTVIILVADTKHNSRVLRATRESLRGSYPLDTRQVLAALAAARDPGRGGIVVL